MPLLYTMEVWWTGFHATGFRLLVGLGVTFVLLLGYNRYAGLREDASMTDAAIDSVEELGLGLALATLILWLSGRIDLGLRLHEVVGQVVVEGMAAAIGVSVGTAQLGGDGEDRGVRGRGKRDTGVGGQLILAACGAVLLAANVAPTEEVRAMAAGTSPAKLVGIALLSIVLAGVILHHSEFRGASLHLRHRRGALSDLGHVAATYAVAIAVSAALLWFFGRLAVAPEVAVGEIVVLGLVATLGASAGRLILQ